MKEKIKKILFTIAEIGTVIWAIHGMWRVITIKDFFVWLGVKTGGKEILEVYGSILEAGVNILLIPLLFYFLSAVLILYLLRKYERKN